MKALSMQMKRVAVALGSAALLASCGARRDRRHDRHQRAARRDHQRYRTDDLRRRHRRPADGGPGQDRPRRRRARVRRRDRIPTAAELRRRVIYMNYRAILDITAAGGYGTLYGPNIDINGNDTLGEGKIAGKEILAYADNGTGKQNVVVMVQIPSELRSRPMRASSPRRRPARAASTARSAPPANGASSTSAPSPTPTPARAWATRISPPTRST